MEYNSALENEFESILLRWINLEPALQTEVNQKAKNKYSILMHIYGMLKNSTNEPICRAARDTQTYKQIRGHSKGRRRWDKVQE